MIKLILILIIIILLCLTLKKEHFSDNFVDSKDCNFVAWGPTKEKCEISCRYSELKNLFDKDKKCTADQCKNKCDECDDKHLCQWTDIDDTTSSKSTTKTDGGIVLKGDVTNKKFILNWTDVDIDTINKYLIHYRELDKKPLHIINNELNTSITFNIDNDKHIPTINLKSNTNYEFIVYGLLKDNTNLQSNKLYVYTSN